MRGPVNLNRLFAVATMLGCIVLYVRVKMDCMAACALAFVFIAAFGWFENGD